VIRTRPPSPTKRHATTPSADNYADNGYWPPQIYVRISNRLNGSTLLTQNNLANPRSKPDGVAMGCWEFDQVRDTPVRQSHAPSPFTPSSPTLRYLAAHHEPPRGA